MTHPRIRPHPRIVPRSEPVAESHPERRSAKSRLSRIYDPILGFRRRMAERVATIAEGQAQRAVLRLALKRLQRKQPRDTLLHLAEEIIGIVPTESAKDLHAEVLKVLDDRLTVGSYQ